MSKDLPEVIINSNEEEVKIGKDCNFEYNLKLLDSAGIRVKKFSEIGDDAKATLTVTVSRKGDGYPDENNWVTYKFGNIRGLEKKPNGKLKFTKDVKKNILRKKNELYGKLIKSQDPQVVGNEKSVPNSDISYKIISDSCNATIRVDVYQTGVPSNLKEITDKDDRLDIKLIWIKRTEINLEDDGFEIVSKKIETWHIVLMGMTGIILLLGLIFHRRIINWIKGKKKKSRTGEELPEDLGHYQ